MKEKNLRSGFTTGTCGAGAAYGAAVFLLSGERPDRVNILTPKGTNAVLPLIYISDAYGNSCGVKKDAGDDPDVTNGTLVCAMAEFWQGSGKPCYEWTCPGENASRLYLTAGEGIGWVTRPGLTSPVGYPAINPVPREMIFQSVRKAQEETGRYEPLLITVWMPEGRALAEKTFNPKLGITGGLSVLGTSGVVEPMSEAALTATIALEIHMKAVEGKQVLILTPGNYGETFLKDTLGLSLDKSVRCSNFLKDACSMAGNQGMKQILLAGHLGKLIKAAGGVGNTHSKYGDRRMEILWECTKSRLNLEDGDEKPKEKLLTANTTEEAVDVLKEYGILQTVMEEVVRRIRAYTGSWAGGGVNVEVVVFTLNNGILGMSPGAGRLIRQLKESAEGLI